MRFLFLVQVSLLQVSSLVVSSLAPVVLLAEPELEVAEPVAVEVEVDLR
jgi:hypothetical protein